MFIGDVTWESCRIGNGLNTNNMISQLHIENFRSIEKATFDFGRITLLTGSNNSGKSSVMYALQCLQGIRQNPNRPLDALFNLPAINLGGFKDVVYKKNERTDIVLKITLQGREDYEVVYSINISSTISRTAYFIRRPIETPRDYFTFTFPFSNIGAKKSNLIPLPVDYGIQLCIDFDGFNFSLNQPYFPKPLPSKLKYDLEALLISLNGFHEVIELIPVRRGFIKPSFGRVPLQIDITTEDEIATQISLDLDLQDEISNYLKKITNRSFAVRVIPNTSVFFLRTTDLETGFENELVNEGTGTNQLVTMLAKALQPNKKFICIDEPEIHLHPSMIEKLVEALVEISYKQDKQFLLSTHSEHFVTCLLSEVVKKNLQPDDLKVYYLTKEQQTTKVEHQAVNADGQIEGGLKNFYESELKNLETFFKVT